MNDRPLLTDTVDKVCDSYYDLKLNLGDKLNKKLIITVFSHCLHEGRSSVTNFIHRRLDNNVVFINIFN